MGHLPKEISRFVYFILLQGASASATVIDAYHRRSPLVQGGLEIPIKVIIQIPNGQQNELAINELQELVREKYKEPIDGKFEDATSAILARLKSTDNDGSGSSDDADEEFDL